MIELVANPSVNSKITSYVPESLLPGVPARLNWLSSSQLGAVEILRVKSSKLLSISPTSISTSYSSFSKH